MDPVVARKTWRTLEPIHGMIYFTPEGPEQYGAVGLTGSRMGYFASRSAAMGPVPAEVVIATFFNFNPDLVRKSIPAAWSLASPDVILAARYAAVDAALRRAWGDDVASASVEEAATLARRAAQAAVERPEGRPLFAGHASLPWPDAPHLVLWHAQTLLREFRGDAHIAALTLEGLHGIDSLVIHAATGDVPAVVLQTTRAWPDELWADAVERMRSRGFVSTGDELALTDAGRAHRQWVEDRTDAGALLAYTAIGEDGCDRLRQLGRPLSKTIIERGLLTPDPKRATE
jgi:hypothetical protein